MAEAVKPVPVYGVMVAAHIEQQVVYVLVSQP